MKIIKGERYLMPSGEVAIAESMHGWGVSFRYTDENIVEAQRQVPMTSHNLRYIVPAAPEA